MVVAHLTVPKFRADPESGVKIDLGPPWNNVGPVGTSKEDGAVGPTIANITSAAKGSLLFSNDKQLKGCRRQPQKGPQGPSASEPSAR